MNKEAPLKKENKKLKPTITILKPSETTATITVSSCHYSS